MRDLAKDRKHRVFVYGSLLAGESNHRVMQGALGRLVGRGRIRGFSMYSLGGFPAVDFAEPRDGVREVHGEVYEVDGAGLERLDALEGEGHFYRRVMVDAWLDDGVDNGVLAWVYVVPGYGYREPHRFVEGGDWRAHRAAIEEQAAKEEAAAERDYDDGSASGEDDR